ncbi:MAG: hypothetical protein PVI90_05805 [Desulfobacteraceae bacterium]|jgi:hypothetical protein
MFKKNSKYQLPTSVDEAAEVLIADLLTCHMDSFNALNEKEFDQLYTAICPYVLDEFKLWSGNDQLLSSCLEEAGNEIEYFDPAKIILKKIKSKLMDTYGIIIIT